MNKTQHTSVRSEFLTTPQMASFLGIKPNTAEIWRVRGIGPKFVKLGRAVRYRVTDLEGYILEQTRNRTNQPTGLHKGLS